MSLKLVRYDPAIMPPVPDDVIPADLILDESVTEDNEAKALLQEMGRDKLSKTLFRDDVIREICSILISGGKPNAILMGPAGSGKTEIVEEIARRMKNNDSSIPEKLKGYTIYSLSLSELVSGTSLRGELEQKVKDLIDFLEDPENKAILFLDEIHMLFESESYKNIAQMLKPSLGRGKFMVIAATTTQEIKKVDTDPAFSRRFTRVLVDELNREQTEKVLLSAVEGMEKHYGVKISFDAQTAKLIIGTADEYCSVGSHRPDNALTLMDRAVASKVIELQTAGSGGGQRNTVVLDNRLVEETAFRLTSGNSTKKVFDGKSFRKALGRIKGQQDILDDITKAITLYDLHLRPHNRPLTFLFAGPSGVGKSEVAKIIAEEYVGEKPIILNMAEYNSSSSINRIIGAPAGYVGSDSNRELPFDALDTNPYQVILLDEFEKCDRSVQRLFMSAFDEGVMVTNFGKEIDFSKTIIIATTNAGCTQNTGKIGFLKDDASNALSVTDLSVYFDTELINRFTHKYTFHTISKEIYAQILRDCLKEEIASLKTERVSQDLEQRLKRSLRDKTVEKLCNSSYDSKLGARPARTAVQEYVDNTVLSYMSSLVKVRAV